MVRGNVCLISGAATAPRACVAQRLAGSLECEGNRTRRGRAGSGANRD
jgi:hypothetical protein